MTPAESLLRDEIARSGPISFGRFMETALYHPEHGYYRRARDPFGREGDFFTAEQLQPVFGILMERIVGGLFEEMGRPERFTVVELGAGRRELAEALRSYRYVPLEIGSGALPERFEGVALANEFFDALPVDVFRYTGSRFIEQLVDAGDERFTWVDGDAASGKALDYLERLGPPYEEGQVLEMNIEALKWIDRIATALERGYVLVIDYGYTRRELVRHPAGTLMGYRRHSAVHDVLATPGDRDITAHVPFTLIEETAAARGFRLVRFESLAATLLRAGEADRFASALDAEGPELRRRKLQLKTLLFGMGETFRTLLLRKTGDPAK